MHEAVVVINAGSTSVKFGAYAVDGQQDLRLITRGEVSEMNTDPKFIAKGPDG